MALGAALEDMVLLHAIRRVRPRPADPPLCRACSRALWRSSSCRPRPRQAARRGRSQPPRSSDRWVFGTDLLQAVARFCLLLVGVQVGPGATDETTSFFPPMLHAVQGGGQEGSGGGAGLQPLPLLQGQTPQQQTPQQGQQLLAVKQEAQQSVSSAGAQAPAQPQAASAQTTFNSKEVSELMSFITSIYFEQSSAMDDRSQAILHSLLQVRLLALLGTLCVCAASHVAKESMHSWAGFHSFLTFCKSPVTSTTPTTAPSHGHAGCRQPAPHCA